MLPWRPLLLRRKQRLAKYNPQSLYISHRSPSVLTVVLVIGGSFGSVFVFGSGRIGRGVSGLRDAINRPCLDEPMSLNYGSSTSEKEEKSSSVHRLFQSLDLRLALGFGDFKTNVRLTG
jgi:hypothetical protein